MSLLDYIPARFIPLFADPEFKQIFRMHAYEFMSPATFEMLKRMRA